MKKAGKWIRRIVVLMLCLAALMAPCQVMAEVDDVTAEYLKTQLSEFLAQVYSLPDEQLAMVRESGDYYQVLVDGWNENKEIVGELKEIGETTLDSSDAEKLVFTTKVKFDKYDCDVVTTFDAETMSPLNTVMNIEYSLGEKMAQAAQNMAVGLIVVFGILLFLMFVIWLFRFIPGNRKPREDKEKKEK
ncbi:MAG: OadG family protein, partial [Eubacterium sp.]|nr:OadG family protein [Eubacterium sp.]